MLSMAAPRLNLFFFGRGGRGGDPPRRSTAHTGKSVSIMGMGGKSHAPPLLGRSINECRNNESGYFTCGRTSFAQNV